MLAGNRQTLFQKIVHCTSDLSFKVVHYDQSWCVIFKGFPCTIEVGYNNILDVLNHSTFIRPMLFGMRDVPYSPPVTSND